MACYDILVEFVVAKVTIRFDARTHKIAQIDGSNLGARTSLPTHTHNENDDARGFKSRRPRIRPHNLICLPVRRSASRKLLI